MSLEYNRKLIPFAKQLRRDATPQEKHLWYDFLRSYPVRFQRQKVIGSFIVDFYCHEAKLAIELDGSQHYSEEGKEYDSSRTAFLEESGIRVLRFSNPDVDGNFRGVCVMIDNEVKGRIA